MVLGSDHFSKDPLCYNEALSYISTLIKKVDFNVCLLIR